MKSRVPWSAMLAAATIWLDVLVSADGASTVDERHALAALLAR